MKKLLTLLTLALISIGSAWAEDAVSATQTFSSDRATCTWTEFNVSIAKGNTAGGDGLYFTAPEDKALSASGKNIEFGSCAWIGYVEVPSASSAGTITIISSTDNASRKLYLESGFYLVCAKTGSSVDFTASDVVSFAGGYYIKLSNTDKSDYKAKSIKVELSGGEKYPESVAVDPVFSLSKSSISTAQTAQICVGSKANLDGIAFDGDVTYGTPGIVEVDAEGVVTPVAAGTTTINFNSGEVAGKYNASTGNSLTITVTKAITVFDGEGLLDCPIILNQENVETYDYLSCNYDSWKDKGWSAPYSGNFLDWKTGRKITLKVKNVDAFELFVNGTAGRKYTIKVGDTDAVEYTQIGTEDFISSGVIATGTTGEVTLEFEGGSNTLYPVYVLINPSVVIEVGSYGWATFTSEKALDFTDSAIKAYIVTGASGTTITKSEALKTVPAYTPLLLNAPTAKYAIPAIASSTTDVSANLLRRGAGELGIKANDNDGYNYVLVGNGTKVEFQRIVGEDPVNVPENKAILALKSDPGVSGARSLNLDGDVTAIKNIKVGTEDNIYYDLQGRRVLYPTKGLYIVNGKKVIIK